MPSLSLPLAFVAGLLSMLSPCVFSLVPIYLGYLSGASLIGPKASSSWRVFSHALANQLNGVLGACIEIVLSVDDAGQRTGIVGDVGHIQEPADIRAAMTDKDTYPRFLAGDIALGRIFFLPGLGPARTGQQSGTGRGSTTGLNH